MGRSHYVYILDCSGRYLYTGCTVDLNRRLSEHRKGVGSKFTRSHQPLELVYYERFRSRSRALRREAAIKRFKRDKKLALIAANRLQSVSNRQTEKSAQFSF